MGELNAELRHTVAAAEVDHPLERGLVLVAVQAEAAVADASHRRHMRGLGHQQSGRTHRELAQVHQMPVVGRPIVGHVLAHGRHHEAVGRSARAFETARTACLSLRKWSMWTQAGSDSIRLTLPPARGGASYRPPPGPAPPFGAADRNDFDHWMRGPAFSDDDGKRSKSTRSPLGQPASSGSARLRCPRRGLDVDAERTLQHTESWPCRAACRPPAESNRSGSAELVADLAHQHSACCRA